jgi:hypothetical protein
MKRDSLTFARAVLLLAAGLLAVLVIGTALDLRAAGYAPGRLFIYDYNGAHLLADLANRGLNQVMALSFTVVAIAVPLTANLYSLKFLDFFVKDRINAAVLILVVSADLLSFWANAVLKPDFIPTTLISASFGALLVCLCVLFPYLLYVFSFLHPNTLLARLEDEICSALETQTQHAGAPRRGSLAAHRQVVAEGLEAIANIGVRSVERTDRATALASVNTLERVAHRYWALKPGLPADWFKASPSALAAFSSRSVEAISDQHTWVEMLLLWQLRCLLSAAVPRLHDVADNTARVLRHLGMASPARADPAVRELVIDYFNTFLRLTLTRHDLHSSFALFDDYRQYAESLNAEAPASVLLVAYYLEYYGQVARDAGLGFLVTAAARELGELVQFAWQAGSPNAQKLLERFMHFDAQDPRPSAGIKKAQAILASYFLLAGQPEAAEHIRRSFAGLDPAFVAEIQDDLLHIRTETYWEITERRSNIHYVDEPQRAKLAEFFASLAAA